MPYTHHYFKKFIALSWQSPGLSMRELDEVFAAILMGSLGIFVRNMSADALIIAFARLSLGFLFLLGFLGLTRNLRATKVSFSPYCPIWSWSPPHWSE